MNDRARFLRLIQSSDFVFINLKGNNNNNKNNVNEGYYISKS